MAGAATLRNTARRAARTDPGGTAIPAGNVPNPSQDYPAHA